MAGTNIGRVEFIVGLDGSRLGAEARKAGAKIAKFAKPAGEEFGDELGNGAGDAFESRLSAATERVRKKMKNKGRIVSKTFSEGFTAEVKKTFSEFERNVFSALSGQKGFDKFSKNAGGARNAVFELADALEQLKLATKDNRTKFFADTSQFDAAVASLEQLGKRALSKEKLVEYSDGLKEIGDDLGEVARKQQTMNVALEKRLDAEQRIVANDMADWERKFAAEIDRVSNAQERAAVSAQREADAISAASQGMREDVAELSREYERQAIASEHSARIAEEHTRVWEHQNEVIDINMDRMRRLDIVKRDLDHAIGDSRAWARFKQNVGGTAPAMNILHGMFRAFSALVPNSDSHIGGLARRVQGFEEQASQAAKSVGKLNVGLKGLPGPIGLLAGKLQEVLGNRGGFSIGGLIAVVLSAIQPLATLASGVSASLVALLSSVALAAGGALVAVGGLAAALVFMGAKAIGAFQMLNEAAPIVQKSSEFLQQSIRNDTHMFATLWGGALADFQTKLAELWRDDHIGEAMGRSMAVITNAFTSVLASPAYAAFQGAMETTLPTALALIGTALASITQGLLQVFATAGPFIELFAARIAEFWGAWQQGIDQAAGDGSLATMLAQWFNSLNLVLDLVEVLGSILGSVFEVGAKFGDQLLTTIIGLAEQFDAWINSVEGQNALEEWFSAGVTIFNALIGLVGELGGLLGALVTPATIEMMVRFIDNLGRSTMFFETLLQIFGNLDLFGLVAELFATIGNSLALILGWLEPVATIIRDVLIIAFNNLSMWLTMLAPLFIPVQIGLQILSEILQGFMTAAQPFWDALDRVRQALQTAVDTIIATVVPAIQQLIDKIVAALPGPEELARIIDEMVIPAIMGVADFIVALIPVLTAMVDVWLNGVIPSLALAHEVFMAIMDIVGRVIPVIFGFRDLSGALTPFGNAVSFVGDMFAKLAGAAFNAAAGVSAFKQASAVGSGNLLQPGNVPKAPAMFSDEWRAQMEREAQAKKWKDLAAQISGAMGNIGSIFSGFGSGGKGGGGGGGKAGKAAEAAKKAPEVFKGLADDIISEFSKGIHEGRSEAEAAVNSLVSSIKSAPGLDDARESNLVAYVRGQADALDRLWGQYDESAKRLKEAQDELTKLVNQRDQTIGSVASSLSGGLNLRGATSFARVSSRISTFAGKIQTFAGLLQQLAAKGIPPTLLQQVAALGVIDGTKVAKALLQGTDAQLGQVGQDWLAIDQWATTAGTTVSGAMFDVGIAAQEGLIEGLTKETDALKAAAQKFADNLVGWVRSALGIHSPSLVFQTLGQQVVSGFARGLSRLGPVSTAMRAMMRTVSGVNATISPTLDPRGYGPLAGRSLIPSGGSTDAVQRGSRQITFAPGSIVVQGSPDPARTANAMLTRVAERIGG